MTMLHLGFGVSGASIRCYPRYSDLFIISFLKFLVFYTLAIIVSLCKGRQRLSAGIMFTSPGYHLPTGARLKDPVGVNLVASRYLLGTPQLAADVFHEAVSAVALSFCFVDLRISCKSYSTIVEK